MKVAIVSTPRTCSSLTGDIFTRHYGLKNKSEIISSCDTIEDVNEVLQSFIDEDNFVVKITSTSLRSFPDILNHNTCPWHIFDKIVLTERAIIENQYASWLLLSYAQQNNKSSTLEINEYLRELFNGEFNEFKITTEEIRFIKKDITHYYDVIKPHILSLNLPTYVLTHELFQNNKQEYLVTLNQLLNESFVEDDILDEPKSSIEYTKFIEQTNLKQLIEDTDVTD